MSEAHQGREPARGGATNVGVATGVRRTISAGVSRSPLIVPNAQPASLAMTTPGGDVVGRLAEEGAGLKPAGGDEHLLAAGSCPGRGAGPASDRGSTARKALVPTQTLSWLWNVVGVAGLQPLAVAPGPLPLDGPVQLAQRRDRDHAQDRLSLRRSGRC